MEWIDYQKAYNMVPHRWISECLEMFGIAEIIRKIMIDSMWSWKLELTSPGENLGDLHIQEKGGGGGFYRETACSQHCLMCGSIDIDIEESSIVI